MKAKPLFNSPQVSAFIQGIVPLKKLSSFSRHQQEVKQGTGLITNLIVSPGNDRKTALFSQPSPGAWLLLLLL